MACLDGLHDLVRKSKDLGMGKAADDLALLDLNRGLAGLCLLNDGGEVLLLAVRRIDVSAARISCSTGCPQAVLIAVLRGNNAVGGHQNRSVEGLELGCLLPPCIAIVAGEVVILLEERIVVSGQHLGVGVDIHTGSLRLLQQHLQILQVMAGDQDAGVCSDADVYLRDLGVAIGLGVCLVEEGHALHAVLAGLQGKGSEVICTQGVIECCCKGALQEGIDFRIILKEGICVLRVGGKALQTIDDELAQGPDVLILGGKNADCGGLLCKVFSLSAPESCLRERCAVLYLCKEGLLLGESLLDALCESFVIEVCVGYGGEEVHGDQVIDLCGDLPALLAERCCHRTDSLGHVDEKILQRCRLRLLSADAAHRAALAARSLLTLKTKHLILHDFFLSGRPRPCGSRDMTPALLFSCSLRCLS